MVGGRYFYRTEYGKIWWRAGGLLLDSGEVGGVDTFTILSMVKYDGDWGACSYR